MDSLILKDNRRKIDTFKENISKIKKENKEGAEKLLWELMLLSEWKENYYE